MKRPEGRLRAGADRAAIFAGLTAAAIVFVTYLPALLNGFVNWDDQACVYENPNIRTIDGAFFRYAFTAVVNSNWHPLTVISYAIDHSVWALDPLGYHLTNNIFHSLNAFLVAVIAIRLVRLANPSGSIGAIAFFTGLISALVFGLHPLRVESVAWIAERKDVLSGFFFLLSIYSYLRYAASSSKRPYILSIIFFILALLSKPMAVTLPVVLLILDYYPLSRLNDRKNALIEKIPFFLLAVVLSAVTIWAQGAAEAIAPLDAYPLGVRVYTAITAYAFYLYKTIVPTDLVAFYPREFAPEFLSLKFIGSLALLICVTVFTLIKSGKNRAYLSAWLFYIVTLFPVSGIVQVGSQAAADRYTYIPALSIAILFSVGIVFAAKRFSKGNPGRLLAVLSAVLAIVLGYLTWRQTGVWRDSVTLWSHEIRVYPEEAPIGYTNLGLAYKALGDHEKAVFFYDKAISIDPLYSDAYVNRGVIYMAHGDNGAAVADFSEALKLNPMNLEALNNRGAAHINAGDFQGAISDITEAIERNPANPLVSRSYYNRGMALRGIGDMEGSIKDFTSAIGSNPMFSEAYNSRGLIHLASGRPTEAAADFLRSIEIDPAKPIPYFNLGLAMQKQNEMEEAASYFNKAASMGLVQAKEYMESQGIR